MVVVRYLVHCLAVLVPLLALPGLAFAQATETELLYYKFNPPLDTDIVLEVKTASALVMPDVEHVEGWSHEVVIRLDRLEGDEFTGTFQLRNVVDLENAQDDIQFLIARALEGEIYPLRVADIGLVTEVDWVAIRARIEEELPRLTTAANAAAIKAVLPVFTDPPKAVLRPINAAAQAYFLTFRRDGELNERTDIGPATYLGLDPAKVEIGGGFDPEVDAFILDWLVTSEPEIATEALGDQLRSIVGLANPQGGTGASDVIEAAIAEGIEAAEDGYAIYVPDQGLMREVSVNAIMAAGDFAHFTQVKVTRLAP
jgi:hypothetical protein